MISRTSFNSGMVRDTEVQLYIDFTLTVPNCNPTRPYREGEGNGENLGTRPGSQRLFVRGICLSMKSSDLRSKRFRARPKSVFLCSETEWKRLLRRPSEIRHRSIPPHVRENLWLASRVPSYPGYFTLNSIKQRGGARPLNLVFSQTFLMTGIMKRAFEN